MKTYNVGMFITSRSSQELQDLKKEYNGKSQIGYVRGLTRKEVVEYIGDNKTEKFVIYCPETDSYVDDYFREDFMNLNSNYARLLFDEGKNMLQWKGDYMVFQGNVAVNMKNNLMAQVKWVNSDTPVIVE